jgi:hypothetical protein
VLHRTGHAIDVFFDHLAAVRSHWLAIAVACHLCKLVVASRAWRNIVKAAYPTQPVRWRAMFAAYVALVWGSVRSSSRYGHCATAMQFSPTSTKGQTPSGSDPF